MVENSTPPIGEILVSNGLITETDLERALELQSVEGGRLCYNLIRMGFVSTEKLTRFFQDYFGFVPFRLDDIVSDHEALKVIPAELANFYKIVPTKIENGVLFLAVAEGTDNTKSVIPAIQELTGLKVEPVVCPHPVIIEALDNYYGSPRDRGIEFRSIGENIFIVSDDSKDIQPLNADIISENDNETDWLRTVIAHSIKMKSREIHITPKGGASEVLFRSGKELDKIFSISLSLHTNIVNLVRKLSKLDYHKNSFRKYEGYLRLKINDKKLTAEIAVHPTSSGTSVVIKTFDKILSRKGFSLIEELFPDIAAGILGFISKGEGAMIIAGPFRDEGKSVLYSILERASELKSKVISIEKEILMNVKNVMQTEYADESGIAAVVESAVAQSPGVLAVSDIEDGRSLEKVFLASAKLPVIIFLPAYDPFSILNRLKDSGLKSAVKAGVLKFILTVRGIEKLCPDCRLEYEPEGDGALFLEKYPSFSGSAFFVNSGCPSCYEGGVMEKIPALSVLELDSSVNDLMDGKIELQKFEDMAVEKGYSDVYTSALILSAAGKADLRDLIRMARPDEEKHL